MQQQIAASRMARAGPAGPAAVQAAGTGGAGQAGGSGQTGWPLLAVLFVICLLPPVYFNLGALRLSPYRVVLILAFLPLLGAFLAGRGGRVRLFDLMIMGTFLWGFMGFLIHLGIEQGYQPGGILVIEGMGAYLLGRVAVRNAAEFERVFRLVLLLLLAMLPFAMVEAVTGRSILLDLFRPILPTFPDVVQDRRLGLDRVQGPFEHSILFGAFCSSVLGIAIYTDAAGRTAFRRHMGSALSIATGFLSVSVGALLALGFQFMMLAWDHVTRRIPRRWTILGLMFAALYIAIDLLSNRTPFHVFITYMTFSTGSAYNRILIWQYGTAEVMRNPLLGIGLGEWQRPSWMGGSIDNFWLVIALRHGLPAIFLFLGGVLLLVRRVGRAPLALARNRNCRAGFLVSLGSMMLAGCTVHYWNAVFVWFMFLAGSGVWLLEAETGARAAAEAGPGGQPKPEGPPRRRTVLSDPPLPGRMPPGPPVPPPQPGPGPGPGPRRAVISSTTAPRQSKGSGER